VTTWQVHLEFEEGGTSKFWRARVETKALYVNYGRIGSTGQTQIKQFPDDPGAQRELDKLVREKRKKGYVDAASGAAGADDDDDDDDDDAAAEADAGGDDDDDDAAAAPPPKRSGLAGIAAAAKASRTDEGIKLVFDADGQHVETRLVLDGKTVRMDSLETHPSPEAAKKAHDRLKKALIGEGYKEG
jgi:predicted DNA-binding WGR domain protein